MRARGQLEPNRDALDCMRDALVDDEVVDGAPAGRVHVDLKLPSRIIDVVETQSPEHLAITRCDCFTKLRCRACLPILILGTRPACDRRGRHDAPADLVQPCRSSRVVPELLGRRIEITRDDPWPAVQGHFLAGCP